MNETKKNVRTFAFAGREEVNILRLYIYINNAIIYEEISWNIIRRSLVGIRIRNFLGKLSFVLGRLRYKLWIVHMECTDGIETSDIL